GHGVGHVRVLVVGVRRKLPAEQTTVEFPAARHIGNGNGEVTKVSSHCFSLRRQNRRTHSASYHMNCCEKQKVTRARVRQRNCKSGGRSSRSQGDTFQ